MRTPRYNKVDERVRFLTIALETVCDELSINEQRLVLWLSAQAVTDRMTALDAEEASSASAPSNLASSPSTRQSSSSTDLGIVGL